MGPVWQSVTRTGNPVERVCCRPENGQRLTEADRNERLKRSLIAQTAQGASSLSSLVAVAYPDESTARDALATLGRLQKEQLIELNDVILAKRDGDKIKLEQGLNLTAAGAASGAFWGGLIGLIFLAPVAGIVIGAASGALSGKLTDIGIDDKFAKELSASLPVGGAALLLLIRKATADKVTAEMKQFGGTLLHTNLTEEAEAQLAAALAEGQTS